jgi:hypothetical protein
MAVTIPIQVGDEVKLRKVKDTPISVVLLNTSDHFCCVTKEGYTFNTSRAAALPMKTGRHFDADGFLKSIR